MRTAEYLYMMDCWFSEVTKIVGPPLLTQQAHSWVAYPQ